MHFTIRNAAFNLDEIVDLPVSSTNRQELISMLTQYLAGERSEVRDGLVGLFPMGHYLDTYAYYDMEQLFEEEFLNNLQDKRYDIFVRFENEGKEDSFVISIADNWKAFVEINYAEICEFLESCFELFLMESKWHAGDIDGIPALWYGPDGKKPIDKWCIKCGEKAPKVWFEDEPWAILDYFVDNAPEGFLIWYTAEKGGVLPDMRSILKECPISISEDDTIEDTNFKIIDLISRQEGVPVELSAVCSSEKEMVSIGFGISDYEDEGLLWIGMSESFWENVFEFEGGINKVKAIVEGGASIDEAISDVFGHFELEYTLNGFECSLPYTVDADEFMSCLLKQLM